jgi:hypothetical protein
MNITQSIRAALSMVSSCRRRATSHVMVPIEITNIVMKAPMRSVSVTSIRDCAREEKIRAGLSR